jgi:hypothetical protein
VAVAVRPVVFIESVDTNAFPVRGVDHHGLITERDTLTNRERP